MHDWESNPRAVPLKSNDYPADWSQPIFGDRVDPQTERHIEMKKKAIDFLRTWEWQQLGPDKLYIETEYLWLGFENNYYFDVAVIDEETKNPLVVVEVGRVEKKKLQEIAQSLDIIALFHWPYGKERPRQVITSGEPEWNPDELQFVSVE